MLWGGYLRAHYGPLEPCPRACWMLGCFSSQWVGVGLQLWSQRLHGTGPGSLCCGHWWHCGHWWPWHWLGLSVLWGCTDRILHEHRLFSNTCFASFPQHLFCTVFYNNQSSFRALCKVQQTNFRHVFSSHLLILKNSTHDFLLFAYYSCSTISQLIVYSFKMTINAVVSLNFFSLSDCGCSHHWLRGLKKHCWHLSP